MANKRTSRLEYNSSPRYNLFSLRYCLYLCKIQRFEPGVSHIIGLGGSAITAGGGFFSPGPNREYITSVESISGGVKTIPSMLILCGIYIVENWAEENNLDEDILLATSPTGYSNGLTVVRAF